MSYLPMMTQGEADAQRFKITQGERLLEEALAKASVGTIQQGTAFESVAGSEYAPFVPQFLDAQYKSEIDSAKDRPLQRILRRKDSRSPLTEYNSVDGYGSDRVSGFYGEGGLTGLEAGKGKRGICTLKPFGVFRKVSQIAEHTAMINGVSVSMVDLNALAIEQQLAMSSFSRKMERALAWGDSSLSTYEADGLFTLIDAAQASNGQDLVRDKRGEKLTVEDVIEALHYMSDEPRFAAPTDLLMPASVFSELSLRAASAGRTDLVQLGGGVAMQMNPGMAQVTLVGPTGQALNLHRAPLLSTPHGPTLNTAAEGEDYLDTSAITPTGAAATNASSQFASADAGSYRYRMVPHGVKGVGAPITTGAITVAAGESVTLQIPDGTAAATDAVQKWEIHRTNATGDLDTLAFMAMVAVNGDGTGTNTAYVDHNADIPGTNRALMLDHMDGNALQMYELFRPYMLPIPITASAKAFLLSSAYGIALKHGRKQLYWKNCG